VLSRAWVTGWACDLADPDRELDVGISINGRDVAVIRANALRRDLQATGKHGSGRHGFAFAFPEHLPLGIAHDVLVYFKDDGKCLSNGKQNLLPIDGTSVEEKLASVRPEHLRPFFLVHVPRSGSTFVMDVLSKHVNIAIAKHYPYEVKVATYYANAARVLSHAAELSDPANPTEFMRDSSVVGFNPFNHPNFSDVFENKSMADYYFRGYTPYVLGETLQKLTKHYYACIAIDEGKEPTCFVEKCELDATLRANICELFPRRREIILIRDMRDVYCSYMSYFPSASKDYAIKVLDNSAKYLMRINEKHSPDSLFIRYEDCVADAEATFRRIWQFLDVAPQLVTPGGESEHLFSIHATSGSVKASVGRWRHDLAAEEQAECSALFDGFLAMFDYER